MKELFEHLGDLFKPQVLLYKITRDADLTKGQKVAYKDTDIIKCEGERNLYTVDGTAYVAEELKLLTENPFK